MKIIQKTIDRAIGFKVDFLTVIEYSHTTKNHWFKCMCDCGNTCIKDISELRRYKKRHIHPASCGCLKTTGQRKRNAHTDHKCFSCNKEFKLNKYRSDRLTNTFCSTNCYYEALRNFKELSPSYKERNILQKFFDEKWTRLKMSARKRKKEFSLEQDDLYKCYINKVHSYIVHL